MTLIKRKGADCCCDDWKEKIKYLWQNYREVVRGIKTDNTIKYPDGNGIVDLGVTGKVELTDNETFYTLTIYNE